MEDREKESMGEQMESRAASREPHAPKLPAPDADVGTHWSALDVPSKLDAPLAQMAAAISALRAPAEVRRRCLSEARRRRAESWRGPEPTRPGRSTHQALLRRLRLSAASSAGLLVVAAVCWGVFTFAGVNPFGRLWPAAPGSHAAASGNSLVPDANDTAAIAGYVSLPYSDPSIANGTEATLEVSMPASQLMAWGVPAPGAGPDDVIPVDLVLGADGLPMAVQVLPATDSTSTNIEEIYP